MLPARKVCAEKICYSSAQLTEKGEKAMLPVIVCIGKPTLKKYYLQDADVTPYVGADSNGLFGVGALVFREDGTQRNDFWGLFTPGFLIQTWRGMKLLEAMPSILNGSLCNAYTFSKEAVIEFDEGALSLESSVFGDRDSFRRARAQVLSMFPEEDELAWMLRLSREHKVELSEHEIEDARASLAPAEVILERLKAADAQREERKLAKAKAQARHVRKLANSPKGKRLFKKLFG